MLLYLDYLDYMISGPGNFSSIEQTLKFDLLIFNRDQLFLTVPACVKRQESTDLLVQLDSFWQNNKILLQLDKSFSNDPMNYFKSRQSVLERGMTEEQLHSHFEFIAYNSGRVNDFFKCYLPETVRDPSSLFIGRCLDADKHFREKTRERFEDNNDRICRCIEAADAIKFTGITSRISGFASDSSVLFERALIKDAIADEYSPNPFQQRAIKQLLDEALAITYAEVSDAVPISLIYNQLTGKWLKKLLRKSYRELYSLICEMSWDEIYALSQDKNWQNFVEYINKYINLLQNPEYKNNRANIENSINSLSHMETLMAFLGAVKELALDAAKEKLFEVGAISEIHNLEELPGIVYDSLSGKIKPLLEVLRAIDSYANTLTDTLSLRKSTPDLSKSTKEKSQYKYR